MSDFDAFDLLLYVFFLRSSMWWGALSFLSLFSNQTKLAFGLRF